MVYRLGAWRNRQSPVIPQRVFDRPPSAELRPDQTDQDSLPPYEVLDAILHGYVEEDRSVEELIAAGFDRATVERVARLVIVNEYKRRQAAPGRADHPARFRAGPALSDYFGLSALAGQRRGQMRLHLL
jgi:NAD+ synthase (glutamine-hydrolysing)